MYGKSRITRFVLAWQPDRALVGATIIVLIACSAAYTIAGIGMEMSAVEMTFMGGMDGMGIMAEMAVNSWNPTKVLLVFLMWWVMMILMMLPSAAPTILLYAALLKGLNRATSLPLSSIIFLGGYLLTWAGFSLIATASQWWLEMVGIVAPNQMMIHSGLVAPLLLVSAGAYQFLPFKRKCLSYCRNPAGFIASHHRPGLVGAARLGVLHGAYCLGCCIALMALLFVGGVMNLYWIFGLAALVALEKLAPCGLLVSRLVGGVLVVSGTIVIVAGG